MHVWRVRLDVDDAAHERLLRLLAPAELERARRFRFQDLSRRFINARGALRTVLGGYLAQPPGSLRIEVEPGGRPFLPGLPDGRSLRFSVSHACDLALLAFTWDRAVGVDVEDRQRPADFEVIAGRFFAPGERTALEAVSGADRREAFFNAWTRKEAYLKARGTGLTRSLQDFEVSLLPGEPARLVRDERDPQAPGRWSLQALDPGPGYAAALAVEGQDWELATWQF